MYYQPVLINWASDGSEHSSSAQGVLWRVHSEHVTVALDEYPVRISPGLASVISMFGYSVHVWMSLQPLYPLGGVTRSVGAKHCMLSCFLVAQLLLMRSIAGFDDYSPSERAVAVR